MDTRYSVIIDKLSVKYLSTTDKFYKLINLLKVKFPFVKLRSWSTEQSIYNKSFTIRSNKKDGTLFIGYHTKWCKTKVIHSKPYFDLFLVFNPSKITKKMKKIVRYIHRYFKLEWTISAVDIAFDVPIKKNDIFVIAKNRKKNVFKTTFYYGKRNSRGHLKLYDKISEMIYNSAIYDKKTDYLTRIEYTYKPNPKDKITKNPMKMDIKGHFDKSYKILNISNLKEDEQQILVDVDNNGKNSVSKSKRRKFDEIVDNVGLALKINDFEIVKKIFYILNDSYYSTDLAKICLQIIKGHFKELKRKISLLKIQYLTYLKIRPELSKTFLYEVYHTNEFIGKPLLL